MNCQKKREGVCMSGKQRTWLLLFLILTAGLLVMGCQAKKTTETASPAAAESKPVTQEKVAPKPVDPPAKADPPAKKVARREDAGLLSVDKLNHAFGRIEPRAKVRGEYILTNTGKETLEIDKVGKSCGCTVPELETKILEPGQSVPLKITFSASDRPGKVEKKLWVTTKAPHLPEKLTMTLTATVVKFVEAKPDKFNLTIMDGPQTETLVLESIDDQPFKVTGFTSNENCITVNFDKDAKATRHELTLDIDSTKLRKTTRGNLVVRLDHPKVKTVTLGFVAVRPFVAKPATKFFRSLQAGSTKEAVVTVVSSSSADFELGDVTSEKGLIEVLNTEKTKDGYKIRYQITIPEDKTSGRVKDLLKIAIKDHPEDTITVTCYGRIK
jgi:hypothetical protein